MKLSLPSRRKASAFTLIELLTVIAIIAILAALLLAVSGMVQEKAGRARAEAEIKALSSAIEKYKLDNGEYPESQNGNSTDSTKVLIEKLALEPMDNDQRPYFDFPPKMLSAYKTKDAPPFKQMLEQSDYLVDPFGNAYHYQFEGEADRSGEAFFDLWSQGRKNTENEETWVKNW